MTLRNGGKKLAAEGVFSERVVLWILAVIPNDHWRTQSKSLKDNRENINLSYRLIWEHFQPPGNV